MTNILSLYIKISSTEFKLYILALKLVDFFIVLACTTQLFKLI